MKVLAWPAFENKTGNPYTRLLYEGMEGEGDVYVEDFTLPRALVGDYDVLHVHWPDDFLSYTSAPRSWLYVIAELVLFAWTRVRGVVLVWTVHDLGPHESHHTTLEALFWRVFIPMVDGVVMLSEAAREEAYARFPALRTRPVAVVPHGHYRSAYPDPVARREARTKLCRDEAARVATFFGRIRPYKNVPQLVRIFRNWEAPDARLVVAGNPASGRLAHRIEQAARSDERVVTELRFVESSEVPLILGAANLVVLPYKDIMHSGTALLSLSFDRPVLVPDRGAMSELQSRVGTEWVRTYDDLTPTVLAEAMEWAETANRSDRAPLDDLDWPSLAQQTIELYRRVLDRRQASENSALI